jgi:cystathionine beta-lyase/cystathionine gamma-synthase
MEKKRFHTLGLHGGGQPSASMRNKSKSPPIYQTSVFSFEDIAQVEQYLEGSDDLYMYTRLENPNQRDLEARIAALEGAEESLVTSSGMSAILVGLLSVMEHRGISQLLVPGKMYGGTRALLRTELSFLGIKHREFDFDDLNRVEEYLRREPSLIFFETIANPSMTVAPFAALADLAKRHGAAIMVDNTFTSPVLFRPLEYGADLVVHSSTKYLNGHSDATGGVLSGDSGLMTPARRRMLSLGCHLNPFEAWLTLRGIQTLALRMERHSRTALQVAQALAAPGTLSRYGCQVSYPLLSSAEGYEENLRLFPQGCGGMLSFDLGNRQRAEAFVAACELISFSPSLAGVKTTLSHPATTSHRNQSDEELAAQGIGQGTIRLSVGLEDVDDILEDLRRALAACG